MHGMSTIVSYKKNMQRLTARADTVFHFLLLKNSQYRLWAWVVYTIACSSTFVISAPFRRFFVYTITRNTDLMTFYCSFVKHALESAVGAQSAHNLWALAVLKALVSWSSLQPLDIHLAAWKWRKVYSIVAVLAKSKQHLHLLFIGRPLKYGQLMANSFKGQRDSNPWSNPWSHFDSFSEWCDESYLLYWGVLQVYIQNSRIGDRPIVTHWIAAKMSSPIRCLIGPGELSITWA